MKQNQSYYNSFDNEDALNQLNLNQSQDLTNRQTQYQRNEINQSSNFSLGNIFQLDLQQQELSTLRNQIEEKERELREKQDSLKNLKFKMQQNNLSFQLQNDNSLLEVLPSQMIDNEEQKELQKQNETQSQTLHQINQQNFMKLYNQKLQLTQNSASPLFQNPITQTSPLKQSIVRNSDDDFEIENSYRNASYNDDKQNYLDCSSNTRQKAFQENHFQALSDIQKQELLTQSSIDCQQIPANNFQFYTSQRQMPIAYLQQQNQCEDQHNTYNNNNQSIYEYEQEEEKQTVQNIQDDQIQEENTSDDGNNQDQLSERNDRVEMLLNDLRSTHDSVILESQQIQNEYEEGDGDQEQTQRLRYIRNELINSRNQQIESAQLNNEEDLSVELNLAMQNNDENVPSIDHPQRISQQNILEYFNLREGSSTDQLIEEFMVYFQYLIKSERNQMKEQKLNLTREKLQFLKDQKQQFEELSIEKKKWEENQNRVYEPLENIIDLDVGGTHKITTTRTTLCQAKDSTLAAMFSGRHKLSMHNGRVFIDRDGESFCLLINYLRNSKLPIFENKVKENQFFEELDYWNIPLDLNCGENDNSELQSFDANWCANTLELSSDNKTLKKNNAQHGIVFCNQPLDIYNPYVEFKIKIDTVFKGKSHLFCGLVDRCKYRPEYLTSTFWRDAPSSMYWDVWNTKLIKTDERGQQIGGVFGYGCSCEDNITRIGIQYDAKNRTVSYYKNGICQGKLNLINFLMSQLQLFYFIAFTNVMSGFYPSLDVWFQNGEIELMPDRSPNINDINSRNINASI